MKRILLAINALLLVLTMSACGQGEDTTQEHSISQNEPKQEASAISTQLENEGQSQSATFLSAASTSEIDLLQELSNSLGYDKETGSSPVVPTKEKPLN